MVANQLPQGLEQFQVAGVFEEDSVRNRAHDDLGVRNSGVVQCFHIGNVAVLHLHAALGDFCVQRNVEVDDHRKFFSDSGRLWILCNSRAESTWKPQQNNVAPCECPPRIFVTLCGGLKPSFPSRPPNLCVQLVAKVKQRRGCQGRNHEGENACAAELCAHVASPRCTQSPGRIRRWALAASHPR